MTTPSYMHWRTGSGPGLTNPTTIKMRQIWALATLVSRQNPDGTVKGS